MKLIRSLHSAVKISFAVLLLSCTLMANAAVDIFLELDGIEGESRDNDFNASIDVIAFSQGASNNTGFQSGGGTTQSAPVFQAMSLTKYIDRSSPILRLRLAQGALIRSAKLSVRKAGRVPLVYFIVELKNVTVTSVSSGGSGGEDRLTENLSLSYTEIKWTYVEQKDDGSVGDTIVEGWNLQTNTKL